MAVPSDTLLALESEVAGNVSGTGAATQGAFIEWARANSLGVKAVGTKLTLRQTRLLIQRLGLSGAVDPATWLDLLKRAAAASLDGSPLTTPAQILASDSLLREIVEDSFDEIARASGLTAKAFQTSLTEASMVPKSIAQIGREIAPAAAKLEGQVKTIANTALSRIQRRVQNVAALDIPEEERVFLWSGPDDDKVIRPFCDVLAGYVLTPKQIGSLDNKQGLSVAEHGGGYNCRHTLVPMTRDFAKQKGHPFADAALIRAANRAAGRSRRGS